MRALNATSAVIFTPALYFALGVGLHLFDDFVNQYVPYYSFANWFEHRLSDSLAIGCLLSVVIFVLMAIDACVRPYRGNDPMEFAYHPTVRGLNRAVRTFPARLVLVAGLIALLGWYAYFHLQTWGFELWRRWSYIAPPYAGAAGLAAWALAWYADCLARPNRSTIFAAACFLLLALWVLVIVGGMYGIRE
jgi:hypothetical protein